MKPMTSAQEARVKRLAKRPKNPMLAAVERLVTDNQAAAAGLADLKGEVVRMKRNHRVMGMVLAAGLGRGKVTLASLAHRRGGALRPELPVPVIVIQLEGGPKRVRMEQFNQHWEVVNAGE